MSTRRLRVFEHPPDALRRVARVDGYKCAAGQQRSEDANHHLDAVRHRQQSDERAARYAACVEERAERTRTPRERSVGHWRTLVVEVLERSRSGRAPRLLE